MHRVPCDFSAFRSGADAPALLGLLRVLGDLTRDRSGSEDLPEEPYSRTVLAGVDRGFVICITILPAAYRANKAAEYRFRQVLFRLTAMGPTHHMRR
jgi:hypothetical protein